MDAALLRFMANQRARVRAQLQLIGQRAKKRRDSNFELVTKTAQRTRVFTDVEYPRDQTREHLQ